MMGRAILAAAVVLWLATPARGQEAMPSVLFPTVTSPQQGQKKKGKEPWGFRWEDHPTLHLGRGTRIDFRFRLQADVKDSDAPLPEDDAESSALDIAKRRIGVDGEIVNLFDFQIERELAVDNAGWRDVYINYKQFHFAEVQAGKFKMPFSLDENTSSTNLDFVFRSLAAMFLAPGRDIGVMAHGRLLTRGMLRYEIGAFDHDGRNARRATVSDRVYGDRTFAGRVTLQPFRALTSPASDLSFGVAFTDSNVQEGFPDLRGRTALDLGFYRPNLWVNGSRQRIGVEARWRPRPFSIKSEFIRLTDERKNESVEDTDLSPFLATGWYVSGTWAITGEAKADGLVHPKRPFLQGGVGAIEAAARVEKLRFGSTAPDDGAASDGPRADVVLGNSDRAETLGVNWYLNRWVKVQFNMIRETIARPDLGPLPSQPTFWSRVLRFQFSM
jgi:phosphate-selective porin OprO and OprP